ncbi:MAG: hypothetical protein HOI95_16395 [Chromatiales bacterium]|nr:hypothetical protein [Chromatiales bacterium]
MAVQVAWISLALPRDQIHLAAFFPALAHCGFERVTVGQKLGLDGGSHFHHLHHKHFECNYGGSLVPLDRLFGTFHDGTVEADTAMRDRLRARRRALREGHVV